MATSWAYGLATAVLVAGVGPAVGQEASTPANRDRRVITTEEIEKSQAIDAYQVVEKLRPEFLRRMTRPQTLGGGAVSRGGGSLSGNSGRTGGGGGMAGGSETGGGTGASLADPGFSPPEPARTAAVFVDGTEMGGVEELQRVASNLVEEIRFLSGSDAQTKYGSRFSAGVIEVKLKTH